MDRVLEGQQPEAVGVLRRELMAYVRRHGDPGSDFAGAEVIVAELVSNASEHAPGPAWVRAT
jgi:anti-sigma regulatory factor (Ser/Thr protein kinase)